MVTMQNWESLIAARMRPCATICKVEDASKRNRANREKKHNLKPERIEYKKKYRTEHRDELNAKKRAYRATEEGKRKTHEYNEKYRLENYEKECARKRAWWRKKNPNPRPIGRPKKEAA